MKIRHVSKIIDVFQRTCYFYSYYLLLHLLASLCHILYFDAAKFSIKLFSLVYVSVSIVRQRNEYEIGTETHKYNQLSLPRH